MNKQYFNLAILLFCALNIYAQCQNEPVLAYGAAAVIFVSLVARIKTGERQYALFGRIPLSAVILGSLLAGFLWRNIYPPPDEAVSPFPFFTAVLQSGSIFGTMLIWLRPYSQKNAGRLFFLAWLTVALSINVPFSASMLFAFSAFCLISVAIVILQTMNRPNQKKYKLRYYRDFVLYSFLLVTLTTGLFYGISRSIVIADETFMRLISDYAMPRRYTHFLKIEPFLNLVSPGSSAWNRRPVFEIAAPGRRQVYLRTQIFEDFDSGVWTESKDTARHPLSGEVRQGLPLAELTMFTSFEDIIPSPYGIVSARGPIRLTQNKDGIMYTQDEQRTRVVSMALSGKSAPVTLSAAERKKYTAVPLKIAAPLKQIAAAITEGNAEDEAKVLQLQNYFLDNFLYALDVNFKADNEGLITMLVERRAAYCTYFATAMTLLLRAEGIPARVAAGFSTNEIIDKKTNKFLARVSDAHAWVEVLLSDTDPHSGARQARWRAVDPTPSRLRGALIMRYNSNYSRIAENIWLGLLRLGVFIENLDRDKLKTNTLIGLIFLMLLINIKKITAHFANALVSLKQRRPKKARKGDPLRQIYRRYERYLKGAFGETRGPCETDREVIARLRARPEAPQESVEKIESFIKEYQASRFGFKKDIRLAAIIENMEMDIQKSGE